jgi:hypothetical protein
MMPVRQKRKNRQGSRQTFWAYRNALSATTWREERDTYEARADYRRNWLGPCERKGKSWAEIAGWAAVGAANGLPVCW